MKKIIAIISFTIYYSVNAQTAPPIIKNPLITSNGLKINSRKGTLIEKRIINLATFKSLNIQKIIIKDTSDNTTENALGIMTEYETYDNISKKTLTIEKPELSKLIQSLQTLEQKENDNKNYPETKYKFVTLNNIEFGSIYKENTRIWSNYIKLPFIAYNQNLVEFNKNELKELIKILKNAEQDL